MDYLAIAAARFLTEGAMPFNDERREAALCALRCACKSDNAGTYDDNVVIQGSTSADK
jgi:hypothetical protein